MNEGILICYSCSARKLRTHWLGIEVKQYRGIRMLQRKSIRLVYLLAVGFVTFAAGCASDQTATANLAQQSGRVSADKLLPVDCLLPPKIKKLGKQLTYLESRRPIKTNALNCEIRGGEYTAYDRADYRTALQVWLEQAKQGDAEAQTYVGEIYEKGLGLPADYKTAYIWYEKAAKQNYSRAQINLGYLYEKGLGVGKNSIEALNWYRRASGVTDDIAYASSIEERAADIAKDETSILRGEIASRDEEIERLSSSLVASRTRLNNRERLLQRQNNRLSELKLEITNRKTADASAVDLEKQYTAQKKQVIKTKSDIQTLKKQVADNSRPVIEVFNPTIMATRSGEAQVRLRSGSKVQTVSGKILAPAGLKLATINGKALDVDSQGLFNSLIAAQNEKTRVTIKAVDDHDQSSEFSFLLIPSALLAEEKTGEDTPGVARRVAGSIDFGRYYALIIGNNKYQNYPPLVTAISDAQRVAAVLKSKYGVNTRLLKNADRYTMLSAINEIKGKLKANDNLLIYYAGHGEIEENTKQGYWLPVDAEQGNTANWIPNSAISDLLNTITAKHVLVVADSCYSGSMTKSSIPRLNTKLDDSHLQKWLNAMVKTRSRTVLTSGGLEPVLDSGGGKHSIFANAFIQQLERGEGIIDAYRIYLNVARNVSRRAAAVGFSQTPTYAPIQHAGHGGGEFVLVSG